MKKISTTVYSAEPQMKHPIRLLLAMVSDFGNSRELAWRLFVRNINAQYRQTILGYLWAFLPPILTSVTFVFLNSQKIINISETKFPYPVYVMLGTLLWQGFADAVNHQIKLLSQSRSMLVKIKFPREALILAALSEVLFNFAIRSILFVAVFLWFGLPVPNTIYLVPVGVASIMLFGFMVGVLLTPLAILYKDIERGLMMILSVWFFLTPVVYPAPTSWPASILVKYNPMSPLILTTRDWMTTGSVDNLFPFICVTICSVVLLVLGWIVYRLAMPHLIARIGS